MSYPIYPMLYILSCILSYLSHPILFSNMLCFLWFVAVHRHDTTNDAIYHMQQRGLDITAQDVKRIMNRFNLRDPMRQSAMLIMKGAMKEWVDGLVALRVTFFICIRIVVFVFFNHFFMLCAHAMYRVSHLISSNSEFLSISYSISIFRWW